MATSLVRLILIVKYVNFKVRHLTQWLPSAILKHFSCKLFVVNLLLACGNVALNPGPAKFPCTVCTLAVKSNQRALLCDSCN